MKIIRIMGYPINVFSTLERSITYQSKRLRDCNNYSLVAFDGIRQSSSARSLELDIGGPEFVRYLPNCKQGSFFGNLKYALSLYRLLKTEKPDIVHSYFEPSASAVNFVAFFFKKIQFVRTIGTTPLPSKKGQKFPFFRKAKWKISMSNYSAILCVAPHMVDMLVDLGIDREKISVVPNPTLTDNFNPKDNFAIGERLKLVFLGRLEPVKNIEVLIDGVFYANRELRIPLHLSIFGTGNDYKKLMEKINLLGASDIVELKGVTDDIPKVLQDSNVYVQASFHEGCPAAVGEAMAAGLIVLASDIPGHKAMISDNETGLLFNVDSMTSLAEKIKYIWKNPSLAEKLGLSARAHISKYFSLQTWFESEYRLYSNLISLKDKI